MKRFVVAILGGLVFLGAANAQQFAKTGVVDLPRVSQYFRDAQTKAIEDLKTSIQSDLDRMKEEIRGLNDQRNQANSRGDTAQVQLLDQQIQDKKAAFTAYGTQKQAELTAAAQTLQDPAAFQKLLSQEIEQSAIGKGFALILNTNNGSVLWYGPDADITDDVIHRLGADLAH